MFSTTPGPAKGHFRTAPCPFQAPRTCPEVVEILLIVFWLIAFAGRSTHVFIWTQWIKSCRITFKGVAVFNSITSSVTGSKDSIYLWHSATGFRIGCSGVLKAFEQERLIRRKIYLICPHYHSAGIINWILVADRTQYFKITNIISSTLFKEVYFENYMRHKNSRRTDCQKDVTDVCH